MSIGEDAAGQLVDAALIGASFERGGHGKQQHDEHCRNCGAPLAGRFCHVCGQLGHIHRSVMHLCEEFFHGLLHLDGKIWRTLPLLVFQPGKLTKRFIEGQRVRFISPIGLFLFTVFLMFFAVATIDAGGAPPGVNVNVAPADREKAKEELEKAKEAMSHATGNAEALGALQDALDKAQKAVDAAPSDKAADAKDDEDDDSFTTPLGFDWRAISKKLAKKKISVGFGGPDAVERVRASLNDPDLLVYKLRSAASEFSFMLVPASVPFLWLMFFWKRRVYLYDHVIFSLHSLSFMALFVTLLIVGFEFHVGRTIEAQWSWLFFVPPIHMFFHLKGTYGIGIFGALWRTFTLSIIAMIVLCLYVGAILMLGLLH
jgi:hypothetical protein